MSRICIKCGSPAADTDEVCADCEALAVQADLAYNEWKNNGGLRRYLDDHALWLQINEEPPR